jgi:hypothetical protein
MVVTRHKGRTFLTLRGPETRATLVDCPADGEWLGIRLKLGAFLTRQPVYEAGYYDQAHMTRSLTSLMARRPEGSFVTTTGCRILQTGPVR